MSPRPLLSLLLALGLWAGCSSQPTPEELAGEAAKEYYERLAAGDCEAFLSGRADAELLPADYRRQLLQVCEQYVRQQEKSHGGIASVVLSSARRDTLQHLTQAFLLLTFRDSVCEEIVVPMIECNGQWRMK